MKREVKDYDTPEKELEDYPDVFADIINALVYHGEQRVRPENLRSTATETRYTDITGKLRKQTEDLGKYEEIDGEAKILFLLANQTAEDDQMILRKCGYTGGYYRGQYKGHTQDICPVMELLLYWGEERWKGKRCIREFFQEKDLPDQLWKFIDNEKIHVFEMRYLQEENIKYFTSDMRIVLGVLSDSKDQDYLKQKVQHENAFFGIMNVLLEEEKFQQLLEAWKENKWLSGDKGGGRTMIDIIGITREDGKQEGIQQGIQALVTTCEELGVTFEVTAKKLKEKFSLTDTEAQKEMQMYWQE